MRQDNEVDVVAYRLAESRDLDLYVGRMRLGSSLFARRTQRLEREEAEWRHSARITRRNVNASGSRKAIVVDSTPQLELSDLKFCIPGPVTHGLAGNAVPGIEIHLTSRARQSEIIEVGHRYQVRCTKRHRPVVSDMQCRRCILVGCSSISASSGVRVSPCFLK
jgi:hypothetical protein